MLQHVKQRTSLLLIPFCLVLASCRDATAPQARSSLTATSPRFAQGDGGIWTVNTLADPGDGTCDDTECTLREAIGVAGSGKVVFASSLSGVITLNSGALHILLSTISIDGGGRISID